MSTPVTTATLLRRAGVRDAPQIQRLIQVFAARDQMLPRSLGELYENIRDFYVVEEAAAGAGPILACAALHVCWSHLAEIKSLAVREDRQRGGHGKALVQACLQEAREIGLRQVFALTYQPAFFTRMGFRIVNKATLPHKVWNECLRCPKFNNCQEVAVVIGFADEPAPPPLGLSVL